MAEVDHFARPGRRSSISALVTAPVNICLRTAATFMAVADRGDMPTRGFESRWDLVIWRDRAGDGAEIKAGIVNAVGVKKSTKLSSTAIM